MNIKLVNIADLKTEGLQTRAGLNPKVVKEYTELLKDGRKLDPVTVVKDKATGELYLVDGYHRREATTANGATVIEAEVTEGAFTDAVRLAIKANASHGLRRTNAEKRNALTMAWNHRHDLFGGEPSNEMLADAVGVSKRWVIKMRKRLSRGEPFTPSARIGMDGKTRNSTDPNRQSRIPNPESPTTDRFGAPVPTKLVPAFASDRFKELVRKLREVQEGVTEELENGNIAFCKVSQTTLITLKNALEDLKSETPFCVCRVCSGQGCRACGNTGIQKKAEYDRNPKEVKA